MMDHGMTREMARLRQENEELRAELADLKREVKGEGWCAPREWGLTGNEELVFAFLTARDVATHDALLDVLENSPRWRGGSLEPRNTVAVYIARIRRKVAAFGWKIRVIWGRGYELIDRKSAKAGAVYSPSDVEKAVFAPSLTGKPVTGDGFFAPSLTGKPVTGGPV